MFQNKKFTITWIAEWIMPWLVLLPGIPAIYYWGVKSQMWKQYGPSPEFESANKIFETLFGLAICTGLIVMVLEFLLSLIGFIWLWVNVCKKEKDSYFIAHPILIWTSPWFFIPGTLFLMLFVNTFTYAMGI